MKLKREDNFTKVIGNLAFEAIMKELMVTPKPGLVDAQSSGSHKDMNFDLMVKSAESLKPFFSKFAMLGIKLGRHSKNPLTRLKEVGLEAEEKMFSVTNGINTHKGVIFSLGLLTAATGYFYKKIIFSDYDLAENLCHIVSDWVSGISEKRT